MLRNILIISSLMMLAACGGSPYLPVDMKSAVNHTSIAPVADREFAATVSVGQVTNGMPPGRATISPASLLQSLQAAMTSAGYGGGASEFRVDANIVAFDADIGVLGNINFAPSLQVQYTVTDLVDNRVILTQTISSKQQASFGDAFFASTRLEIGIGRTIQDNVAQFMNVLPTVASSY